MKIQEIWGNKKHLDIKLPQLLEEIFLTVRWVLSLLFFSRWFLVSLIPEPMQAFCILYRCRRNGTNKALKGYKTEPLQRGKKQYSARLKMHKPIYMHALGLISRFHDWTFVACFKWQVHGNFQNSFESQRPRILIQQTESLLLKKFTSKSELSLD